MRMKHIKFLFALVIAAMTGASAWAATGDTFTANTAEDVAVTYKVLTEDGTTGTVQVGNGTTAAVATSSTVFTIPASVTNGDITYAVTAIGDYAFNGCTGMTSFVIPAGVSSVGNFAFNGCTSLAELAIEDSNETLTMGYNTAGSSSSSSGKGLFKDCPLTTVYVGRNLDYSNTDNDQYGRSPFARITTITNATIGDAVTILHAQLFRECTGISSIVVPDHVTSLEKSAFYGCSGLEEITLPASLQTLGIWVFGNCTSLTTLTLPNNITSIEASAFRGCSGLTSISLPGNLTSIGTYAFYGCTKLTSIEIPTGVTTIPDHAFYNCTSLATVSLPAGLNTIDNYAFYGCKALTSVQIPDAVTTIDNYAFCSCENLASVTISENSSLTTLGSSAFNGYNKLASFYLPPTVTSIGGQAFRLCTLLEGVYISDLAAWCSISFGDTEANPLQNGTNGVDLYLNGTKVENLVFPSDVTTIGVRAFYKCRSLKSVHIPNTVTSIGDQAFYFCSNLTSMTIAEDNNLESIGPQFIQGTGITEFSWPSNLTTIGSSVLYGAEKLETVYIPNTVTSIGDYAFYSCIKLTNITIPSGVTNIGQYAFCGTKGLRYVYCDAETAPGLGNHAWSSDTDPRYYQSYSRMRLLIYPYGSNYSSWEGVYNNSYHNFFFYIGEHFVVDGCLYQTQGYNTQVVLKAVSSDAIQNGVLNIPEYVSYGDKSYYVKWILEGAFEENGTNIEKLYVNTNTPPELLKDGLAGLPETCDIYVPSYYKDNYEESWGRTVKTFVGVNEVFTALVPVTNNGTTSQVDMTFKVTSRDPNLTVQVGNDSNPSIDTSTQGAVVIPETVTYSGETFTVTNISQYAFNNCNSITQVTIPSTVVNIDKYAFYYCSSLARVNVLATVPPTIQYSSFSKYSALRMIVVPEGCRDAYLSNEIWCELYNYGNCTFKEIGHESDLFPGESLVRMLPKAQSNDPSVYLMYSVLTSATDEQHGTLQIGNGNNSAYDVSDYNANYNLVLPDTVMIGGKIYDVVRIGANAFSYFSSSSGGSGGELQKSNSDVAENSNGLVSITIPACVTRIDAGAFYNCACLTKVTCLGDVPPFCEEGATGESPYVSKSASKSPAKWMKKAAAKLTKGDDDGYSIPTGPFSNINSNCMLVVPNGKKEDYVDANWDMAFGRIREKANESVEVAVGDILGATARIKNTWDSWDDSSDADLFVQVTSLNPKTVQLTGKKIYEVYDGEYYFYSGRAVDDQKYYNWDEYYNLQIPGPVTVMGDDYDVTALGMGAFYNAYYLTSIELPNSITKIDDWAFEYCEGLSSIELPSSLTTIGEGAFYECTALQSIEIPDAVTKIGQGAFYYCYNMLSATLGRGLSEIAAGAFAYCNSLTIMNSYAAVAPTLKTMYVYLDENGEEVEDGEWHPFSWSYPLPTLNVPAASVNDYLEKGWTVYNEETEKGFFSEIVGLANPTVGSEVFFNGVVYNEKSGSYQVTIRGEVTKNKTITVIGAPVEGESYRGQAIDPEGDYYGTLSMPSTVNLVDTIYTITSIGEFAFVGCENLLGIEIPSTITEIGDFAFQGCVNISTIEIPDSVQTVGAGCFSGSGLYNVKLGTGLTEIGAGAFMNCSVNEMYSYATTPPTLKTTYEGETIHPFTWDTSLPILPMLYVPFGSYTAYSGWSDYFSTIEELLLTVKTVEGVEMKFKTLDPVNHTVQVYGCHNKDWEYTAIDEYTTGPVTIPAEVTSNGVTYSVKAISDFAFYDCRSVTSFVIPEGIETIGRYAFYQCDGSKSLVIPNSVKTIGECAFLYWYNVETITLGSGLTSIEDEGFAGCNSLSTVYCNATNPPTIYASWAFSGYSSDAVLYVPDESVEAYQASAWSNYFTILGLSQKPVIFTVNVDGIPMTFKVTNAVEGNYTVQTYGFLGGNSLVPAIPSATEGTVTIPETVVYEGVTYTVTAIGEFSFTESLLASVSIPRTVSNIGNYAFANCPNLNSVAANRETPAALAQDVFMNIGSTAILHVPAGTKTAYDASSWASYFGDGERIVEMGGSELEPGDVSGDGAINVTDVTALVSIILGNASSFTPAQLKAADLNNDGVVNVSDVTALVSIILNQ